VKEKVRMQGEREAETARK